MRIRVTCGVRVHKRIVGLAKAVKIFDGLDLELHGRVLVAHNARPSVHLQHGYRAHVIDALFDHLGDVPVLLVVSIDLTTVAAMDKDLDRVGLAAGASVYPFVWNILLAARSEGLAGVVTNAVVPVESEAAALLGLPETHAIAAMVPLGFPERPLTRLTRKPVEHFTTIDRFDGRPLA